MTKNIDLICPHCPFEAKSKHGLTQHVDTQHPGKPQKAETAPPAKAKKLNGNLIRCKVHRRNCDETNAMIPITVNTCNLKTGGKKIFVPGTEVMLTPTHIEILKLGAVEPHDIIIPGESGIYQAADPLAAAAANYPGYTIHRDKIDGTLHATMDVPNYIVEVLP